MRDSHKDNKPTLTTRQDHPVYNNQDVLVKYHFRSQQGFHGMTAAEAAEQQGKDLGHATHDCFAAIERGEYPKWELCVQIMSIEALLASIAPRER